MKHDGGVCGISHTRDDSLKCHDGMWACATYTHSRELDRDRQTKEGNLANVMFIVLLLLKLDILNVTREDTQDRNHTNVMSGASFTQSGQFLDENIHRRGTLQL